MTPSTTTILPLDLEELDSINGGTIVLQEPIISSYSVSSSGSSERPVESLAFNYTQIRYE